MISSFARRQFALVTTIMAIAIWLIAFSSVYKIFSVASLNEAVSFSPNRDIFGVIKVERGGKYNCLMMFEPEGSVFDELRGLYEIYITHVRPPAPDFLQMEIKCSAYRIDDTENVQTAHTMASEDLEHGYWIHLTRVRFSSYFGFELTPGVYVLKASVLHGSPALARSHVAARVDLVASPNERQTLTENPLLPIAFATALNPCLFMFLVASGFLLLWRTLVAVLGPIASRVRNHNVAGHATSSVSDSVEHIDDGSNLSSLKKLSPGKKKLVMSIPLIPLSLALFHLFEDRTIQTFATFVLVGSVAVAFVGVVETYFAVRIEKYARAFASLHPFLRGSLSLAIVIATIGVMFLVARVYVALKA